MGQLKIRFSEQIDTPVICIKVLKYASDQPPPKSIKMEYIRGAAKAGLNVEAGITRAQGCIFFVLLVYSYL